MGQVGLRQAEAGSLGAERQVHGHQGATSRALRLWGSWLCGQRESLSWVIVENTAWAGSLNGKQRSEHLG